MIVRQFISWVRTAPAGERAGATRALARAWLISDLSQDDRITAEGALLMLLDDPSPLVRQAMSDVFAASADAPPAIVAALAADQPDIALPVLEFSPLLLDADLVDLVATGCPQVQCAVARRVRLPVSVAAALAEVGDATAVLELIENPDVTLAPFSLERIVERHGDLAVIREALLQRESLPASVRLALATKVSATLAGFAAARDWITPDRANRLAAEATERSLLDIANLSEGEELSALIHHLRESGQLNASLVLRALLSGNASLFEAALVELTGVPQRRVTALAYGRGAGLDALLTKAGFPRSTVPAFRAAVAAILETGFVETQNGVTRLQRRMVERVLMQCENEVVSTHDPLLVLLRRFSVEAAREDARLFCDETATQVDAQRFVQIIEDASPVASEDIYGAGIVDEESDDDIVFVESPPLAPSFTGESEFGYESEFDDYAPLDENYIAVNDEYPGNDNLDAEIALIVRERIAA
ncbi:DUF2336 domain-containing protein [Afipia felis]|uniref:Uncharacterized protein conserved in bacteria (DUF2336) n=2 Tax=Afipia felis TaxID=1035 RepID=A0A380W6D2_AFIFE|nr:DUF2336 domain-containing protein [Afipia felis]EKS27724.1 hypothetical protein HMPREF9697_00252 [Afipia felis ATCC 53690]SUU76433.1 Uncharacterized protein conserved in bacteria (DUF2336) [Afipia felis]SUU84500.1 Uncharacterized protein conserved in bacteria (DUF2336) [Afipia felis]